MTATVNNEVYSSIEADRAGYDGTVEEGGSVTFKFYPKDGYKVSELLIDNEKVPVSGNQYAFNQVDKDYTLFVQFTAAETEWDILPTVDTGSIRMKNGTTQKINLNLGSGKHKATKASIVVLDSSVVSVSRDTVTTDDLSKGSISVTGLKLGTTMIEISFNDKNRTTVEIPVVITDPNEGGRSGGSSGGSSHVSRDPSISYDKRYGTHLCIRLLHLPLLLLSTHLYLTRPASSMM